MIFTKEDYDKLHTLFDSGYAGYRPEVKELPNGDGKIDEGKRYLHVALKYNPPDWAIAYLARAHFEACKIAEDMEVPYEFYPRVENATLRVLDYPANCGTAPHTDFDLFTVDCYGSLGTAFEYKYPDGVWREEDPPYRYWHLGEIGELVGLGKAEEHRVQPTSRTRQSIVYFAMPSNDAVLIPAKFDYVAADPTPWHTEVVWSVRSVSEPVKVGDWLKERYARSRTYK